MTCNTIWYYNEPVFMTMYGDYAGSENVVT